MSWHCHHGLGHHRCTGGGDEGVGDLNEWKDVHGSKLKPIPIGLLTSAIQEGELLKCNLPKHALGA